ncbi:MAG: preprotein translocase subunit SecY [Candidatus Nomurabacteria bacterium]|nr:preprotein translocase subunit SecY [Candidatus Nomurabacteria bacterium]
MWKKFTSTIKTMLSDKSLRNKVLFVLFALVIFRLLSTIPIPGVDRLALAQFVEGNQLVGLLNLFSGGGLSQLSIIMLGIGPYITASIIMQLMTVVVPRIKEMYHEEGQSGRMRFNMISRYLTIPIAVIQGLSLLSILQSQGILNYVTFGDRIFDVIIVTAGAMLLTWIGELMTEFGIGNGVSILIFAGIIAVIPQQFGQLATVFDIAQLGTYIGFVVAAIAIIFGVVMVTEAERPIPITYAKQARAGQVYGGTSTYLPLRINMAGVMPLIFALSLLLFPQVIGQFFSAADSYTLNQIGGFLLKLIGNSWFYSIFYFVLVFVFTYFYTAITFEPESVAENLQKNGAFVPGVRPGERTAEYLGSVLSRITLVGAFFLATIAVIPIIIQSVTGIASFAIGGTGLLIVVAVVIDTIKKIDAQASMRQY